MSPERWQQIEEIFQIALDLSPSERGVFVRERCAGDDNLKAEVEKLLAQFADASSFIEQPLLNDRRTMVLGSLMRFEEDQDPMLGLLLGNYKITRELGRGGMGAVYEAIRADGEFRHKVAVKIVKRGMDTDFILRRFRNERQILATLEHPYITRLLDGGTTADGRPYFMMDYIEGLPLYRYCDKHRLTINQRLNLFTKICEAVGYAHQSLVAHRDLKPSNILVTNDGSPRLLDFGIAKLLNPDLVSEMYLSTATGLRLMTLAYASPEQVRGEQITFSTDIYSLGVILFELLTGRRPYQMQNRAPEEIARAICQEQPSLPSMAIGSRGVLPVVQVDNEALTVRHLADLWSDSPAALSEKIAGNLDNITLKALQKRPAHRYESIHEFLTDLARHLDGKTISAPSFFPTQIEPAVVSKPQTRLIAVLPLKLFNFSATENTDENYLSIGLADAIISRLTSIKQFTVRPTSSILQYNHDHINPLQAGLELGVDFVLDGRIKRFGEKVRISLQLLDVKEGSTAWAGQFDERFTDVLELEDAISQQVAEALVPQITGETKLQLGKRGTDNPNAYEAYLKGRFYWNQFTSDSLPKAIEWFHRAVALDPNYALAHVGVADFYIWANIYGLIPSLDSYQQAEIAVKRALEIDDTLGEAYATFGLVQNNKFDWAEGKRLHEKAIELNPNYPNAHEWYSAHLVGSGNFAEGIKEIERAEELDPLSLRTKTLVAWTKCQAHQFAQALAKAEEIIDLDTHYPQGHLQRGYALIELGRGAEAVAEIEKAIALMPESALAKFNLAFALAAANRRDEARNILREMQTDAKKGYVKPMFLGFAAVAAGEIAEAFFYFNQAADEFEPWLVWLGTDVKLDPIRQDPRYLELLRRTKNPMVKQFEEKFAEVKPSIAVLPLQFIGEAETDEAYLSVGLADAMITRLSQVQRIIVRPTNSVLRFTNCEDSFAVGRELGVDYVLCGTIRPAGTRIRISAQLLEIKQASVIWSDKFDENFMDVLNLENLVAEKVGNLLIPKLTGEEKRRLNKRGTDNPAAFEAYLRGRYHLNLFTPDNYARAFEYFQQAIHLDAAYALAYSSLAEYYFALGTFGNAAPREAFQSAQAMTQQAIRLDDTLGEAYAILGFSQLAEYQMPAANETFRRAVALNPNYSMARIQYSVLLIVQGEYERAVSEARRAVELNPLAPFEKSNYLWILYQAGRFTEAAAMTRQIAAEFPAFSHNLGAGGWVLRSLGALDDALEFAQRAIEFSPQTPWLICNLAATYAKLGNREKALELLREIEATPASARISPYVQAIAYTALGDTETAFAKLELAYETRDVWLLWLSSDAEIAPLRDDPRYQHLLRRINSPLAQSN